MTNLVSKFKGSLVGAVIGDCIGAHFEMERPVAVTKVIEFVKKLSEETDSETNVYTDDTAMARSVAYSLIENKQVNIKDVARRFTTEFFTEPERGYGASVGKVFKKLKEQKFADPFGPASEQFSGSGSYGNGGAMRISPASLFAFNHTPQQLNEIVSDISKVTHSNVDAINGAILQAYAVYLALHDSSTSQEIDAYNFTQSLLSHMRPLEEPCDATDKDGDESKQKRMTRARAETEKDKQTYCRKLEIINKYLQTEHVTVEEIEEHLGTDVSAIGSVPAAVYSFLRAARPIQEIQTDNPFERTIIYAISLGGDTDTIASMAGAMAGAYYGIECIPARWLQICEGVDDAIKQADDFYKLYETSTKTDSTQKQP